MLNIAVCDDDAANLSAAKELIEQWAIDRGTSVNVHLYGNGDELIAANAAARHHLVFLDIIMPLLNGMDTARELRQQDTAIQIVFLTSSVEFALESYEVKATDYLLKPIDPQKVTGVLDRLKSLADQDKKSIVVKTAHGYQKLYLHEIEYVEAQNKRVVFYLIDGRQMESAVALHFIEEELTDDDGFFKCHRSYLVYLQNVDNFNSVSITTRSGHTLPIARGLAKPFKEAYFAQMFNQS